MRACVSCILAGELANVHAHYVRAMYAVRRDMQARVQSCMIMRVSAVRARSVLKQLRTIIGELKGRVAAAHGDAPPLAGGVRAGADARVAHLDVGSAATADDGRLGDGRNGGEDHGGLHVVQRMSELNR